MTPTLPIHPLFLEAARDGESAEGAGEHQGAAMKLVRSSVFSAKGAVSYQPGATPQERVNPREQGLKARLILRADGSGFQPSPIFEITTQGVALDLDEAGALPLRRARL